jgi:hypothetical protein
MNGSDYTDEEIEEDEKQQALEDLWNILPMLDPFYDDDSEDETCVREAKGGDKESVLVQLMVGEGEGRGKC